ncbi:MAG: hypothetical protein ACMVY4_17065 [Minwuia sp.]|uniref:hypothetical protein n=1 Tax=Minwuia sp. TaxID=2493630 RepID=UPI003A88E554
MWLIRRFADPCARILRADPEHVEAIADKFDASPIRTCGGVEGTLRATAAGWGLASPEIDALASSLSEPGVAEMLERLLCGAAKAFGSDKEREHVGLSFFDAMLAESHDRRNRSRTDD